jgi:magnesium-transporting ATPase (P-type)
MFHRHAPPHTPAAAAALLLANLQPAFPQVLYVNLITAVTLGMMLAAEPPESTVMERPPRRPGKRLLGKVVLWRTTFVCTVMVVIILGFFEWGKVLGQPLCERRAEAFNVLVFMEIAYSLSCRYIKQTALQKKTITENPLCYASIVLTVALQFLLTYTPGLNAFFDMWVGRGGGGDWTLARGSSMDCIT